MNGPFELEWIDLDQFPEPAEKFRWPLPAFFTDRVKAFQQYPLTTREHKGQPRR